MKLLNIILIKNKFQQDVWWNTLTFAVMGASGLALNIMIVAKYGSEILGVFSQVYAVYILTSHIAAFGLYASVLRHISEHSENRSFCDEIITSSLIIGLIAASIASLIYYAGASFTGALLNSSAVAEGMIFSSVGLWCFAINKILLAFLNGKRLMKEFALFHAFRYAMLPLSLAGLIFFGFPGSAVPIIFSVTEFLLLIGLVIFSLKFFSIVSISRCKKWLKAHLPFGSKSILGGLMTDVNTRIDVLMIGAFLSDKLVGIYSLAAMISEGFEQIAAIFKVNYNPLLAKLAAAGKLDELKLMIKTFFKKVMPFTVMVGLLAIPLFPLFVKIITSESEFLDGWLVFAILMAGVMVKFGHAVFWDLPSQTGHPGRQTILIAMVALSNVVLSYFLVLRWGIYGAAAATALSSILGVFYLKIIVKKILGIAI